MLDLQSMERYVGPVSRDGGGLDTFSRKGYCNAIVFMPLFSGESGRLLPVDHRAPRNRSLLHGLVFRL